MLSGSNIYDIAPQYHRFQKHVQIAFFLLPFGGAWVDLPLLARESRCGFSKKQRENTGIATDLDGILFVCRNINPLSQQLRTKSISFHCH